MAKKVTRKSVAKTKKVVAKAVKKDIKVSAQDIEKAAKAVGKKAKSLGKKANTLAKKNPWAVAGIAAGIGLAAGLLTSRKRGATKKASPKKKK